MNCPLCDMSIEEFDEDPDEAVRYICCKCKIFVTIHELEDADEICHDKELKEKA